MRWTQARKKSVQGAVEEGVGLVEGERLVRAEQVRVEGAEGGREGGQEGPPEAGEEVLSVCCFMDDVCNGVNIIAGSRSVVEGPDHISDSDSDEQESAVIFTSSRSATRMSGTLPSSQPGESRKRPVLYVDDDDDDGHTQPPKKSKRK
eukprot:m.89772 g.89772  ORF g.89772 m.89772 type:complete len:148 (+) comp36625_c0_seq3:1773-2216(+)